MKRIVLLAAALPMPTFADRVPMPRWTASTVVVEPATVHTAKPTVTPKKLTHTYRHWGSCGCTMCLGQHLRNMHGETSRNLDKIRYTNWRSYHSKLHDRGKAAATTTGAPRVTTVRRAPTYCTPQQPCRPRIFGLLRGG
jgi:hypothetical protein